MEAYIRLGVLIVVAIFLLLLLADGWFKQRRAELAKLPNKNNPDLTIKTQKTSTAEDFIIINVVAKPGAYFASYDLLQAITAIGMQFGEMNIFHYYQATTKGNINLFSLASATEPGEFNLNQIGNFTCAGLTLFMNLRQSQNAEDIFALMVDKAQQLAEDLDGELRAGLIPWSEDILHQYQHKILHYQN